MGIPAEVQQAMKAILGAQQSEDDDVEGPPAETWYMTSQRDIAQLYKRLDDTARRHASTTVRTILSWRVILSYLPRKYAGRHMHFCAKNALKPGVLVYSRQPVVIPPSILVLVPGTADDRRMLKLLEAYELAPQGADRLAYYQLLMFTASLVNTPYFGEEPKPLAFNGQVVFMRGPESKNDWARAIADSMALDLRN